MVAAPPLSTELENCLRSAFHQAREAGDEYLTVERLLLAILDAPLVREILGACGADLAQLKQELQGCLDKSTSRLEQCELRLTLEYQRVLRRAEFHVQSSGGQVVEVVNVLVAVFGEKQSQAVCLLNRHHATHADVVLLHHWARGTRNPASIAR